MSEKYSELVKLVSEKSGLSEAQIEIKVSEKLKQLSDLISKEGAVHIIANELGLKLMDTSSKLQIKNLLPGMRNVEVCGKVTRLFELRSFKTAEREGKVSSFFMADETAQIRVTMWGENAELISSIKEGDIVKISMAYVKENNGFKELHMGDKAKLDLNPGGVEIKSIATSQMQNQQSFKRKLIKDLSAQDEGIEIFGTVVQVFDPRFFEVCPDCGARARPKNGVFFCEKHGEVAPKYSYVFNVFLDDGTENIRIVLFKSQADRLFKKTETEIVLMKDDVAAMEDLKNSVLGEQIKVAGRVKKNDMYDRLEFNAQLVFTDVNPEEESKILDKMKLEQ